MKNLRVLFMGSPEIASEYLRFLIANKLNLIGVYTQPPRPKGRGMSIKKSSVYMLAEKNNLPIYCPKNFTESISINDFLKLKPDIVIVVAYGIILPKTILDFPKFGFINVHKSLLPRWRGASPVEHALLHGDKQTGVTIFKIEEKLDAGPIISLSKLKIDKEINKSELYTKLIKLGKKLLIKKLNEIFEKKIKYIKQKEKNITYANKINTKNTKIDFSKSVNEVFNQIRAFSPKPGAWFIYNNERIKILKCKKIIIKSKKSVILNEYFHIGCKNGIIIPITIQKEGKNPMNVKDFLRGYSFTVGQKINA